MVYEIIRDPDVRKWYEENINPDVFEIWFNDFKKRNYNFDSNSGLFFKQFFPDSIIQKLNHTDINIIFPRPVDIHYHTDVGEALSVLAGSGKLYLKKENENEWKKYILEKGVSIFIEPYVYHTFTPKIPGFLDFLEIHLNCTGILDPKNEICIKDFYKINFDTNFE